MKKTKIILMLAAVIAVAFALTACNPIENETRSASMLIVENLFGSDLEGNDSNFLESDVLYQDEKTTTIYADHGIGRLSAQLLDPLSITGPSHLNDITVERYTVTYSRSDGRNVPGVDVPYSFDGQLSATISIGSTVDVVLTLVRAAAKMEPPLVNLHEGRDVGVLTVHAKVDFFGHDKVGHAVTATGYLTIYFANYVNEEADSGGEAASAIRRFQ
jgi:hypothetical protein